MTDDELHDLIAADPAAKALADAGNDAGCAALLNTPGATPVAVPIVPRDQFLLALTPAYLALPTKDAATQGKWDRILSVLRAADAVHVNPGLMAAAVADGILTQPQADAAWHRPGSPVEVAFGVGATVHHGDVSRVWYDKGYRPGGIVGGNA